MKEKDSLWLTSLWNKIRREPDSETVIEGPRGPNDVVRYFLRAARLAYRGGAELFFKKTPEEPECFVSSSLQTYVLFVFCLKNG